MRTACRARAAVTTVIAVTATVVACTSAPGPSTASAPAALPVGATGGSTRGVGLEVTARNLGQDLPLPVPAQVAFDALLTVFDSLEIPLTRRDPARFTLGNDGLKMRRKLGAFELRRLFDCGGTSGMPNAETYTITASIVSAAAASDGGGSVVTTVVDATAENPNFPGSGVRCSSTGRLEEAIAARLKARLNAAR